MRCLLTVGLVHVHELLGDDFRVRSACHLGINGLEAAKFRRSLLVLTGRRLLGVGGLGHLELLGTLGVASTPGRGDVADDGHVDLLGAR